MINEIGIKNLRERYSHINPLLFQRSILFTNTISELYDVLEDIPERYPIMWDKESRKWVSVKDILDLSANKV